MSLAILFHFLCAQHVSDINISIFRSLRLCWITTSVVLFSVRCVLEIWCGWFLVHQHSRKLLMMDILMSETCWAHKKWNKIASDIKLAFHSSVLSWVRHIYDALYILRLFLKFSSHLFHGLPLWLLPTGLITTALTDYLFIYWLLIDWLSDSFIHSFIHSFIRSFIRQSIHYIYQYCLLQWWEVLPVRRVYCNDKFENVSRINNLCRNKWKDIYLNINQLDALIFITN